MSDKVSRIYPDRARGQSERKVPVASGAGPTDTGGMEARVAALEATMTDVKVSLARIEGRLEHVAQKSDIVVLEGRVTALGDRVTRLDTTMNETLRVAVSKAMGPWQLPMVIAACCTIAGAFWWVVHQPWFPH